MPGLHLVFEHSLPFYIKQCSASQNLLDLLISFLLGAGGWIGEKIILWLMGECMIHMVILDAMKELLI